MLSHYNKLYDPDIELLEGIAHKLSVDVNLTNINLLDKAFSVATSTLGITKDNSNEEIELVLLQAISDHIDTMEPTGINPKYTHEILKYMESRRIIDLDEEDISISSLLARNWRSKANIRKGKSEDSVFQIANTFLTQLN